MEEWEGQHNNFEFMVPSCFAITTKSASSSMQ
jgi:hypothetical protein